MECVLRNNIDIKLLGSLIIFLVANTALLIFYGYEFVVLSIFILVVMSVFVLIARSGSARTK
jgi:hypothetical protein